MKVIITSILLFLSSSCSLFNAEKGVTETYTFFSSSLKTLSTVLLYYPESYSSNTPVIYLLNGWGTDAYAWGSGVDLANEAYERQAVFVSLSAGENLYYNDLTKEDANYKDYVLEVVTKIENEYGIDIDYHKRAIAGISNGGGGAIYILSEHPDLFIASASLSPSYYSVIQQYDNFINRGLRIDVGTEDSSVLTGIRWFHNKLIEKSVVHDYYEHKGQHNWTFWQTYYDEQFDYLLTYMKSNQG